MNKQRHISARQIAIGLGAWLVCTNALAYLVHLTDWWPLKVLLFICITFLPGVALLRLLHITLATFYAGVVYSFGLSILMLMLSGLLANHLLPLMGITQPLSLLGAIGVWNSVTAGLIVAAIHFNNRSVRMKAWPLKAWPKPALLLLVPSLLPVLAALGAFRLNNGGDALFAALTLCLLAILIACSFIFRRRLTDGSLAWLIFIIGLTVLLMTSLRGWDVVGHDIEREFRVYTLTQLNDRWDITLDRDPYNACLSITILPQMFAQILNISGLVVFKVVLQIVFAVCPVILFVLLRQYTAKLGALAGSLLFICYPTFINDSAMLTRQGVAYLFFALSLLILSNPTQKHRYKLLFILCALGAVLSHYSTAYMFVALFMVATIFKLIVRWLHRRRERPPKPRIKGNSVLSPLFAVALFLMTFIWYTQITATSSGLVVTLQKSIANLPNLFSEENKSTDTATALFFAGGKTHVELYESYLATSREPTTKMAGALQYLPELTSDVLPVTKLGEKAYSLGINPSYITILRQNFAKVLQLLALVGVLYAAYRLLRKKHDALSTDFTYLSLAGILVLGLMVILPVLSINYGVLRAFQQALIFLILPITIFLIHISRRLWPRLKTTLVTFGTIFLFLLFTGLFAQLLGGVSPSLSMNNQGLYYGLFYSSEADGRAFTWLKDNIKEGSDVRAANFNRAIMHDPEYPFTRTGILPTQTGAATYVYLDPAQVQAQRVYLYYESSPLIMTFPLNYYDDTKNQIYSTSSTRIYR